MIGEPQPCWNMEIFLKALLQLTIPKCNLVCQFCFWLGSLRSGYPNDQMRLRSAQKVIGSLRPFQHSATCPNDNTHTHIYICYLYIYLSLSVNIYIYILSIYVCICICIYIYIRIYIRGFTSFRKGDVSKWWYSKWKLKRWTGSKKGSYIPWISAGYIGYIMLYQHINRFVGFRVVETTSASWPVTKLLQRNGSRLSCGWNQGGSKGQSCARRNVFPNLWHGWSVAC